MPVLINGYRPRLLDLYCGDGGAGVGYHRAGFDVFGIDIKPQCCYPYDYHQADALEVLDEKEFMAQFDFVHASPPCQYHTILLRGSHITDTRDRHADLILPTRERLQRYEHITYVIENVPGARAHMVDPITLCGTEFGLVCDSISCELRRHRLFESNVPIARTETGCQHRAIYENVAGIYGNGAGFSPNGSYKAYYDEACELLGIDWMHSAKELTQSIPPAYTEFLGLQLLAHRYELSWEEVTGRG